MPSSFTHRPARARGAKEYVRFCRIHGIFMVDGLEQWHTALKARGTPEDVISVKVSAAALFVRSIEDPFPQP